MPVLFQPAVLNGSKRRIDARRRLVTPVRFGFDSHPKVEVRFLRTCLDQGSFWRKSLRRWRARRCGGQELLRAAFRTRSDARPPDRGRPAAPRRGRCPIHGRWPRPRPARGRSGRVDACAQGRQLAGGSSPVSPKASRRKPAGRFGGVVQRNASACAIAHRSKVWGCLPMTSSTVGRTFDSSNFPSTNGRRIVQGTPDSRTAASERMWYRATALFMSPPGAELLDNSTIRSTLARRISANRPDMFL